LVLHLRQPDLTVRTLFDNYVRERTPQKRSRGTQLHDRRVAELFVQSVGQGRMAKTLNRRDWDRYIEDRRSGALETDGDVRGQPVRDRQVQYDLLTVQAVLNWATTVQDQSGRPLLERNPLKGLEAPRESSPARPMLSAGEYEKLLTVARAVHPMFELALVVAHETGHRMSAIRHLRWSDVDLATKHIRWRAENDKIDFEHTVPMSDIAAAALQATRNRHGAIGDTWVFPSLRQPKQPLSRHTLIHWWERAATAAKLTLPARTGWHALRRQWTTDLKHDLPLKDLAHLGGWKTTRTVADIYQQPDDVTMRSALARRESVDVAKPLTESTPPIHTARATA
jgi:integrase